jgi:hypothetical protein
VTLHPRANLPIVVLGADPAAGAEFSVTVPAGEVWGLLGLSVLLVQGITQTPQPILLIDDGTTIIYASYGASAAQAVSTTARYTWGTDLAQPGALVGATPNIFAVAPLPENLILPGGWRVRSSTVGIGANSDYGAPALNVVKL